MAKLKVKDIDIDGFQEGVQISKEFMVCWRLFVGESTAESLWYVYQDLPTEEQKYRFLISLMEDSKHFQYAHDGLSRIVAGLLEAVGYLPEPIDRWQIRVSLRQLPRPTKHPGEPQNIHKLIGVGNAVFHLLDEGWPLARNDPTVNCHCAADAVADAAGMSYQKVLDIWYNKVGHENTLRRISKEVASSYRIFCPD